MVSLTKLFGEKLNEITKGMGKETGENQKAEREKLKQSIREECKLESTRLKVLALAKDVNGYWKLWSKTVERGWLKYVDEEMVHYKKATGRGKAELVRKKTQQTGGGKAPKRTYLAGKEAREEVRAIRQARRCEQMAFRITLARKDSKQQNVKATCSKLDNEAIDKLRKHQGKGDGENELVDKLLNTIGRDSDIMLVPVLKNAAGKYHEQAGKHKAEAEKKERDAQQKRYAEKGGGQC